MWIIQEPKWIALWNKRHFEEKNGQCAAHLKYSVLIVVEKKYKMQHLEGSGMPILYIGRKVLKRLIMLISVLHWSYCKVFRYKLLFFGRLYVPAKIPSNVWTGPMFIGTSLPKITSLTLILLMWRKGWAPNNASK